jgi:transcription elongation factor Elf1
MHGLTKMSPRKSRSRTSTYVAQKIRNKRKKLLFGPYDCQKCGVNKLRIQVNKKEKQVFARCSCDLEYLLKYVPAFELIDYYNKFIDNFYKK